MIRVPKGEVHVLHSGLSPVVRIHSGESIEIQTEDANCGLVKDSQSATAEVLRSIVERSCPLSGPVFVEEAHAGDTLQVQIHDIMPGPYGCAILGPEFSLLTDWFPENETLVVPIRDGTIHFSKELRLPVSCMIGTIATCPSEEAVFSWKQGPFGGNMDCPYIGPGATVYLPVAVEGGLLFVGDCHARQGDGEIGPPFEIPATIRLSIDVCSKKSSAVPIAGPRVETASEYITIVSSRTFEAAAEQAMKEMVSWISNLSGLSRSRTLFFLAQIADVRAAQIANTLHTAYCVTPRKYVSASPL